MTEHAFDRARLQRMRAVMSGYVERGAIPGIVTLVARQDEVHVEVVGTRALNESEPIRRDTIFRIASLTKPITAAAAMILVEECRRLSLRSRRRPTSGCGVSDRYRCCIIRASSGAATSAWMCSES